MVRVAAACLPLATRAALRRLHMLTLRFLRHLVIPINDACLMTPRPPRMLAMHRDMHRSRAIAHLFRTHRISPYLSNLALSTQTSVRLRPSVSARSTRTASLYVLQMLLGRADIQVICEKVEKSDIPTIDKKKYLVPAVS